VVFVVVQGQILEARVKKGQAFRGKFVRNPCCFCCLIFSASSKSCFGGGGLSANAKKGLSLFPLPFPFGGREEREMGSAR
jgi:hypothetical protein